MHLVNMIPFALVMAVFGILANRQQRAPALVPVRVKRNRNL
jgi:preprotein translocase subunit YajC